MSEKWFSAAGVLAKAPVTAPAHHGLARPMPARLRDGQSVSPARRFTLVRVLSATFVVVAIQILICMDGGIDFGIPAQPILATHGAQAAGPPRAPGPAARRPQRRSLRFAAFLPVADHGTAANGAVEPSTGNCSASAAGGPVTGTDCAAAPRAADPAPAAPGPAARPGKAGTSIAGQALSSGLSEKDRSALILGLMLLSSGDPRLRFMR